MIRTVDDVEATVDDVERLAERLEGRRSWRGRRRSRRGAVRDGRWNVRRRNGRRGRHRANRFRSLRRAARRADGEGLRAALFARRSGDGPALRLETVIVLRGARGFARRELFRRLLNHRRRHARIDDVAQLVRRPLLAITPEQPRPLARPLVEQQRRTLGVADRRLRDGSDCRQDDDTQERSHSCTTRDRWHVRNDEGRARRFRSGSRCPGVRRTRAR